MQSRILEHHGRRAYIMDEAGGDGGHRRVATVYLMSDGWHAKLDSDHTRHAWSGPYSSAEEALEKLAP